MTQDTNTGGAAIQRYKIGYHADEWGQRSSTPSGIPDASGSWVRYADHVTALAAGQATAAQAVVQDDVATLVRAAQAFVLEPDSHKKKLELEAMAWGPLAAATQPAPVLWLSPEQFANFKDTDAAPIGKCIPARKTSAGKFTMPLFAVRAPAPEQPAVQQPHGAAYAATPECLTCSDHGAVGNILTAEPCPDCTRLNDQPAPAAQQAGESVYAFRRKGLEDFCTCDEARYEELSNKPHLFETRVFYTAPQPPTTQAASAQEDVARLDFLQECGATVEVLPGRHGWTFRVGGLHGDVHRSVRTAIDADRQAIRVHGRPEPHVTHRRQESPAPPIPAAAATAPADGEQMSVTTFRWEQDGAGGDHGTATYFHGMPNEISLRVETFAEANELVRCIGYALNQQRWDARAGLLAEIARIKP